MSLRKALAIVLVSAVTLGVGACGGQVKEAGGERGTKRSSGAAETGLAAYRKGDFQLAADSLKKAVAKNPANAESQKGLGQSYEALGKLDDAAKAYEASIKADPGQARVRYLLAIIYKTKGKTKEAVAQLEAALKTEKDFSAARIELGDLYAKLGEKAKAREAYEAVINAAPFGIDLEAVKGKRDAL